MKTSTGLVDFTIGRVLELSGDSHADRRMAPNGSPAFHRSTRAIAAYGSVLSFLVALQEREEFYAMMAEMKLPDFITGLPN